MPSIHPSNKNEKDRKDRWQQNTEKKATASAKCRFDKSMNTQKPLPHSGVPSSDAVSCHLGHRWRRGCFAWQARHLVTLCSLWSPWPPSLVAVDAALLCAAGATWWLSVLCGLVPWTPLTPSFAWHARALTLCSLWSPWNSRSRWRPGCFALAGAALGESLVALDAVSGRRTPEQFEPVWSVEPCLNGVWTSLNQSEACLNKFEVWNRVWTVSEPCSLKRVWTSSERVWTVSERVWTVSEPCLN